MGIKLFLIAAMAIFLKLTGWYIPLSNFFSLTSENRITDISNSNMEDNIPSKSRANNFGSEHSKNRVPPDDQHEVSTNLRSNPKSITIKSYKKPTKAMLNDKILEKIRNKREFSHAGIKFFALPDVSIEQNIALSSAKTIDNDISNTEDITNTDLQKNSIGNFYGTDLYLNETIENNNAAINQNNFSSKAEDKVNTQSNKNSFFAVTAKDNRLVFVSGDIIVKFSENQQASAQNLLEKYPLTLISNFEEASSARYKVEENNDLLSTLELLKNDPSFEDVSLVIRSRTPDVN